MRKHSQRLARMDRKLSLQIVTYGLAKQDKKAEKGDSLADPSFSRSAFQHSLDWRFSLGNANLDFPCSPNSQISSKSISSFLARSTQLLLVQAIIMTFFALASVAVPEGQYVLNSL